MQSRQNLLFKKIKIKNNPKNGELILALENILHNRSLPKDHVYQHQQEALPPDNQWATKAKEK
jgi:hypothetical protein